MIHQLDDVGVPGMFKEPPKWSYYVCYIPSTQQNWDDSNHAVRSFQGNSIRGGVIAGSPICWWIGSGWGRFDKHPPLTLMTILTLRRTEALEMLELLKILLNLTAQNCECSNFVQLRQFGCWVRAENRFINQERNIRVNDNLATVEHESSMN